MVLAAVGMLFSGISTALQVKSSLDQGKAAVATAKYNDRNAQAEARNNELEFMEATKRARINQRKQMSTLRSRLSTQGTRTDTGPALDILGETAGNFQLAISDAARATNMQASAIRQAGKMGKMGIWEAKQVKKAATMQAIGTGIQGITSAVSAYGHNKFSGAIK
jgi:hypothetical protein